MQETGFQKVSKAFLKTLPADRIALFCLHPKAMNLKVSQELNTNVKIIINPRKNASKILNILMAFSALIQLLPFQVIAHTNEQMRIEIENYCKRNDISEVYIEAIWLINLIPRMENVPINLHAHILDSQNLLTSRNFFHKLLLWPFYLLMRRFEKKNFPKINKITTNSPIVKYLIEKEFDQKVYLNKNFYDPEHIKGYKATFSKRVLLVGDFSYRPNMDALMNLLTILTKWPELQSDYEFCVVGRLQNIESFRKKFPLIKFSGFVTNLYEEMSKCCVSICPLDYASGAKIKIIESMRIGLPVITTKECLEASGCVDKHGILAFQSHIEFVEILKSLVDDHTFWASQSKLATEYAKRNFE